VHKERHVGPAMTTEALNNSLVDLQHRAFERARDTVLPPSIGQPTGRVSLGPPAGNLLFMRCCVTLALLGGLGLYLGLRPAKKGALK
jgi:hypothetical protein